MRIFAYLLSASVGLIAPLASAARVSEPAIVQKIDLGFDKACSTHVTPQGDVYALGYINGNPQKLAYTVFKNKLKNRYQGEIISAEGGRPYCSSTLQIIPGQRDDFFVPVEWTMPRNPVTAESYVRVHNVEYKRNKDKIVFSKENASLGKIFFDQAMTTLYVTTSPDLTGANKPRTTTVTAVDMATEETRWSADFLYARKGSVVSPDGTLLYLIGDERAELISLQDHRLIREEPSLIDGLSATVDAQGYVYAGQRDAGWFMAKLQPFSPEATEVLWHIPYSSPSEHPSLSHAVVAPTGLLYVSSEKGAAGPGISVLDAASGETEFFIPSPVGTGNSMITLIAPAIFDQQSGDGYSFTSSLARQPPDAPVDNKALRYDIWRFSATSPQPDILFSLQTGYDLPHGFSLAGHHLYFTLKDTLYVYALNADEDTAADIGVQLEGADLYTRDQADQGITLQYQTPPESAGRQDYYLFSLNEDRTRFGSYLKVKAGKGEAKVKIHKIWHPQGGKFTIGLTDDVTRATKVQALGDSVTVTVIPGASSSL